MRTRCTQVSDFGLAKTLHRDDASGVPISSGSYDDCWKAPEVCALV
jgi:hypothetical protein